MLVIDEATAVAYSEQRVLDWMRAWSGQFIIVGLAISGCRVGEHEYTDLLVLTPRATIVMAVKGTAPEAREGVLSVRADGRWKLSGYDGDPIDIAETESGERPFDRVSGSIAALTEVVRAHSAEARVEGLVVVVPSGESDITVGVGAGRPRCGVVVASTAADLRAWFHRTANRPIVWSAEDAHALLTELGAGERASVEDLVAEGFPRRARLDYLASPEYAAAVSAARRYTEQRKQATTEPVGADGVRIGTKDLRAGEEMVPAAFTVGAPAPAPVPALVLAPAFEPGEPGSDAAERFSGGSAPEFALAAAPRAAVDSEENAPIGSTSRVLSESEPRTAAVESVSPPTYSTPDSARALDAALTPNLSLAPTALSAPERPRPPEFDYDEPESPVSAAPQRGMAPGDRFPEPDRESEFTDDWSSWIGPQRIGFRRTEVLRPVWLDDRAPVDPEPRRLSSFVPSAARPGLGQGRRPGLSGGEGLGDTARRVLGSGQSRARETVERIIAFAPSRSNRPPAPAPRTLAPVRDVAAPNVHRRQQVVALTLIATLLSIFWLLAAACSAPQRGTENARGLGYASVCEQDSASWSPNRGRHHAFPIEKLDC